MTPIEIVRAAAARHNTKSSLVVAGSRNRKAAIARRESVTKIREQFPDMPLDEIGELLGIKREAVVNIIRINRHKANAGIVEPVEPNAAEIIKQVADRYGFTVAQLRGHAMNARLVAARHEAIRTVREACPSMSWTDIAVQMNRDHTTIIYVIMNWKERRRAEREAMPWPVRPR